MAAIAEPITELPVKLTLSKQAAEALMRQAAARGQLLPEFVSKLVERLAEPPTSLEELSGPIYRRFLESGTTDEQLTDELEWAKHEMRAERIASPVLLDASSQ
jgi:hypothetical protein